MLYANNIDIYNTNVNSKLQKINLKDFFLENDFLDPLVGNECLRMKFVSYKSHNENEIYNIVNNKQSLC